MQHLSETAVAWAFSAELTTIRFPGIQGKEKTTLNFGASKGQGERNGYSGLHPHSFLKVFSSNLKL